MVPAFILPFFTFSALLALPIAGQANSHDLPVHDDNCDIDDIDDLGYQPVTLLQNGLILNSKSRPNGELNDAASFSQLAIEVEAGPRASKVIEDDAGGPSTQPAEKAPSASGHVPAMPDQEEEEEEATCSLRGLTPGVCALASLASPAAQKEEALGLDFGRPGRLEDALFAELEAALAGTHAGFGKARLAELEGELAGLFAALPKNAAGLLETASVRYALHQHFLRRHAWYIRSLNPVGEAQRPPSSAEALRGHVPVHLQALLELKLGNRGLGLRDLVALVATLEHLIRGDMGERLTAAFAARGLRINGTVGTAEAAEVLKTFMAHYLSLEHRSGYAMTPEQAAKERDDIERAYDGWKQVAASVGAVLERGSPDKGPGGALDFSKALEAAREVVRRFELNSADECRGIKRDLSAMPGGATGRVSLTDLHKHALDGKMLFAESKEYLAALGALDETGPGVPSVFVPNYVISPSNCLGTTSFYDSCCPNECEALLEELEGGLRAPEATAEEVAALLAARSAAGPLPGALLEEMSAAASAHGGRVALHGFAFRQWLHRAFPLECPRVRPEDFAAAGPEVPGAGREFQAVAALPHIASSRSELLEELQANASQAPAPTLGATSGPDSSEELEAAATKALAQAARGSAKGLKIQQGFDVASFAQSSVEARPAAAKEPTAPAQAPSGGKLRIKGVQ